MDNDRFLKMRNLVKRAIMSVEFLRRSLSHVACALAVFGSGLSCVYPVISDYIRGHFNLTQPQAGVIAISAQVGESLHLPSALTFDSFGPKWTLAVGFAISTFGWIWTWWSSRQPRHNQPDFSELAVMFFITAFGRTYSYCSGFVAMLHNVSAKYRGKVTAFLDALFELAVLMMFVVYRWGVLQGNLTASAEDNSMFFLGLLVIILFLILVPLPFITLLQTDEGVAQTQGGETSIQNDTVTKVCQDNCKEVQIDTQYFQNINKESAWLVIFSLEYQSLLWGTALSASMAHFVLYNITPITVSLSIADTQRYVLIVYKVSILVSRFLCGYLYDAFTRDKHSFYLLVALSVLCPLSQILFLIPFREDYFLTIAYSLSGFLEGGVYLSVPILIVKVYGLEHLGRNVSLIYTLKMLLTVLLQIIFDNVYENYANRDGYCYGIKCFLPLFISSTILGLLAALCCGLFAYRILRRPAYSSCD